MPSQLYATKSSPHLRIDGNAVELLPNQLELPESPPTAVRLIARLNGTDGDLDLLAESQQLADLIRLEMVFGFYGIHESHIV